VEHNLHVTDDQLELYALDRLPDSDLPEFEVHLMMCANCRERLDEIGTFALGMREAPAASETDWFGWLRRRAFSMAMGFVVLVVVVEIVATGINSNGRTTFAPSAALQLTATRGEMPFTAPAREFNLTLADGPRDGGPFRIDVVNVTGVPAWSGLAESSPAGVQVKVMHRLGPGDYFVRLFDASGQMLREYGFRIRVEIGFRKPGGSGVQR
jgi:hypothetical protein